MIKWIKSRIINHWATSLVSVLILVGYYLLHEGKIDFADFKEYLILIPSVILLLMKDFKKSEGNS